MIKKILAIVLVVAIVALASFKLFFSKGDIKKDIAKLVGKDWFNYIVRAMYYFTNNNEYLNNINKYT